MWLFRYIWFNMIMSLLASLVFGCEAAQTASMLILSSAHEVGSLRQSVDCNDAYIYYIDGGERLVRMRREDGVEVARMPVDAVMDVAAWGDYVVTTGYARNLLEPGAPGYADAHIMLWPQDFTEESRPLAMFRLADWGAGGFHLMGSYLFGSENAGGDFLAVCEAQEMLEAPEISCAPIDETGETAMLRYGDAEIPIAPFRGDASLLRRAHFEEETGVLYLMFVDDAKYYPPLPSHGGEPAGRFHEYDMAKAEGCMVMRIDIAEKRVIDAVELPSRKEAVFYADSTGIYSYSRTRARVRHTLWDGTDEFIGGRIPCEGKGSGYTKEPPRLYVEVCSGYAFFFSEGPAGWRDEADGTRWQNSYMLTALIKLPGGQ